MKSALDAIQEAKINNSSVLDLSNMGLWCVPNEIIELEFLKELNLSNNFISYLSPVINKLHQLQHINLSNNCISYNFGVGFEFPCYLPISSLDLSRNNLDQIPEDVFYLKELIDLNLEGNVLLRGIPEIIKDNGYLAIYKFINELRVSEATDKLLEAKLIFVGQGEVGKTSLMKKLTDPSYRLIVGFEPTTHGINIRKWGMDVHFNNHELLKYFNEYKSIDLDNEDSDNKEISVSYYDEYEDESNESENYINSISENYINSIHDDFDEEYRNELFNVPLERNVKTSKYDDTDERNLKNFKDVVFNIWDFGGQEIYYSTHQFFLTKRSIYVFVWDARKEEDYKSFDYWFNTINILSDGSPIIIIMNKSDERIKQIDELRLKKSFPNILSFHRVSCVTGSGFAELKNSISSAFKKLPHVGDNLPKVWLDIRSKLRNSKENFISYKLYIDICESYGINESRANFISSYLHDLGDILHFQNDEMLKQIIILNPDWVTNAFYRLIDNRVVQNNNGTFSLRQLSDVWDENRHPKEIHLQLIRLIENFELSFNVASTKEYIIPELLPPHKEYDFAYSPENEDVKFEYRFKFMPAGIITRFICRNFIYIENRVFWKNGLIIRYEDSLALIKNDVFDKKITISINGEDRSALLGIVRREFENIFDTINLKAEVDYFEMVPCNCYMCTYHDSKFHKISTLRKYLRNNKYTITCDKSIEDVSIPILIKGYDKPKQSEQIIGHLIIACSQLQGNYKILADKKEDSRNSFIANVLSNRSLIAKDQTRWGSSATNKSQGEIDIKIEDSMGAVLGIFEGINLSNADTNKIHLHLEKIFNYDPNGLDSNYIVVYSDADNFLRLWNGYQQVALTANYKYDMVGKFNDISNNYMCGSQIKIGRTVFEVSGRKNSVYHIFVNMNID